MPCLTFLLQTLASAAPDSARSLADHYIDFAPAEISAFSILGAAPGEIGRPGTLKELSLSALNTSDASGKINPGVALEWAPFMTFDTSAKSWERKSLFQSWKNFAFSFATVSDSGSASIALGVRYVAIDWTNPLGNPAWVKRWNAEFVELASRPEDAAVFQQKKKLLNDYYESDLLQAIDGKTGLLDIFKPGRTDSVRRLLSNPETAPVMGYDAILFARLRAAASSAKKDSAFDKDSSEIHAMCREYERLARLSESPAKELDGFAKRFLAAKKEYKAKYWNGWALQVSGAASATSPGKMYKNLGMDRWAANLDAAAPLGNWFQLALKAGIVEFFDPGPTDHDELFLGGRFSGGSSDVHGTLQTAYMRKFVEGDKKDQNGLRFAVGLETKLSESLWIEGAVGGETYGELKDLGFAPNFGLKYGFGSECRFLK